MKRRITYIVLLSALLGACSGDYTLDMERPDSPSPSVDGIAQPGVLTAAEWNDAENWSFWKGLHSNNEDLINTIDFWGIDAIDRFPVRVLNASGQAVINAQVDLLDEFGAVMWSTITDNAGEATLWADVFAQQTNPDRIRIQYGGQTAFIRQLSESVQELNMDVNIVHPSQVQIMFAVDATGSMGDELEFLKVELRDVIQRVSSGLGVNRSISTGAVVYRDKGDDYVTLHQNMSASPDFTIGFLQDQFAGGGGDFPEAVDSALSVCINSQNWLPGARTRLVFLMLDAPPHYERDVVENIQNHVEKAAQLGIKIIPITASGINKETEFLMRLMALPTGGTYVFITDDSGVGNDHLEPTVGTYEVEYLNDLLVRLITEYAE